MRRSYSVALDLALEFQEKFLRGRREIAGSLRRKEPTIGDVDIVTADELCDIARRLRAQEEDCWIDVRDQTMSVQYNGTQYNLYQATDANWGAMLFFLTGPAGYSIAYRRMAKARGWKLDQYGLWESDTVVAGRTEEEIYQRFGKEFKVPELRGK